MPCPLPPATVAAGRRSRIRTGALPQDTPKHVDEASAQHRSHQGSDPSPEISHQNRVYLSHSAQDPERWTTGGCRIGPIISPGSIANLRVRTAWNLLSWLGAPLRKMPLRDEYFTEYTFVAVSPLTFGAFSETAANPAFLPDCFRSVCTDKPACAL